MRGQLKWTARAWLCIAGVALTLAAGTARAEVAAADPIDAAMRACLARSDRSTTAGQVQCMEAAQLAWQSAVDTAWQQLQAVAPASQRRGWETSQRRWKAWREAEAPLLRAAFATTHGTMSALSEADMQLQPVRDRALALRAAAANMSHGDGPLPHVRPCSSDAECEHATFDLNRYFRALRAKLPQHARPALVRAQRMWMAYRDAMAPLVDEPSRVDIIGARVATLKRLSGMVGNS
ncbi:MAG TPA: lysozyme inhibitor LprI family protein [Paraburkholderia sp.]|nr:lysozyme inhibitor LprI family protein [Paraburkholderia sp.]